MYKGGIASLLYLFWFIGWIPSLRELYVWFWFSDLTFCVMLLNSLWFLCRFSCSCLFLSIKSPPGIAFPIYVTLFCRLWNKERITQTTSAHEAPKTPSLILHSKKNDRSIFQSLWHMRERIWTRRAKKVSYFHHIFGPPKKSSPSHPSNDYEPFFTII